MDLVSLLAVGLKVAVIIIIWFAVVLAVFMVVYDTYDDNYPFMTPSPEMILLWAVLCGPIGWVLLIMFTLATGYTAVIDLWEERHDR